MMCYPTILRGFLPIFVAVIFAGCSSDFGENDHFDAREPGRLVEWVKKYHSRGGFEEITFVDGVLSIKSDVEADVDRIWEAGEQTYEILKAYTKAASNQDALKTVRITFQAQFVDKYKNSVGIRPILTLRFDASEAMKYNFEHSYPSEMVDTASIEFLYPLVKNAPQRYCDGNGKFSPIFCGRYWPASMLNEK